MLRDVDGNLAQGRLNHVVRRRDAVVHDLLVQDVIPEGGKRNVRRGDAVVHDLLVQDVIPEDGKS